MNKPKVSVVIAVYNAQQYLKECIDSVLKQTLQDFEIICVDDGSGDASDTVLKEYVETDQRFIVLSQTNKGVSTARNVGIKAAKGEYIYFLDSDDYVEPDALETACKILDSKKLDIVYFDTFAFGEEGIQRADIDAKNRYYARNHAYNAVYTGKKLLCQMLENREYSCPVWKQVIRKEFLKNNNIYFYDGIIHEDELYTLQTMLLAGRVAYIPKILHHRRLRKDSIMTRPVDFNSVYGYFVCVKEAYSFLLQQGYSQNELKEFLSFLKRLMTTARYQYSKLAEPEQKKYISLPEEERFLFQLFIADGLDVIKQRDKVTGEKENLIKEREATVAKLNEAKQRFLLLEKDNTEIINKLQAKEVQINQEREENRQHVEELQQKAAVLEQERAETEQKLHDIESQFSREREENRQHVEELQQKAAALEQERAETEQKLQDTESQFSREREENRKHVEELQQKAAALEQERAETEQKLQDTESQFNREREESARKTEELRQQAEQLEQTKETMATLLEETQKELNKEREFNQKQLERNLQKVKQLEQVKQELTREQAFSHKQLEEKLANSLLLEKVKKEATQKVRELEADKEDITKKLADIERALKKECENLRKQLESEKQESNQLNNRNKDIQNDLQKAKKQMDTVSRELNSVKSGWSFRTGRIITFVPRKIRDWLK